MNHKHLFYFWKVAKLGSVAKAAAAANVTPQTLSGQIGLLEDSLGTALFSRQGRRLVLTEAGALALDYADELFALSAELEATLKHLPCGRPSEFRVGVSDAVPKSLAFRLLEPAIRGGDPVRIVCREWRLERLLAELSVHRLDLVISDGPLPPVLNVRAYNHRLLGCGISFLARRDLLAGEAAGSEAGGKNGGGNGGQVADSAKNDAGAGDFPACLGRLPLLLPGEDSGLRGALHSWLERHRLKPRVVGEFDDTALMGTFGAAGVGAFPVPTVVEGEFLGADMVVLGRTEQVKASYYAISVERRLSHPSVLAITRSAKRLAGAESAGDGTTA